MAILIILMAIAIIILVFYVIEKIRKYSIKSLLLKTFVSVLFIAVATLSTYFNPNHVLSPFVILGLLLGLSGDIWLDLKFIYPKDDKIYSYAGFIVFGIGHILYIIGMFLEFATDFHILYVLLPLIGTVVVSSLNMLLSKPLGIDFKDMKVISYIYSLMLFANPLSSLSLLIMTGWVDNALLLLFIGGLLFAISDVILSQTYFAKDHEKPLDFILNYLTYYSAQFIIAFSIFFL